MDYRKNKDAEHVAYLDVFWKPANALFNFCQK